VREALEETGRVFTPTALLGVYLAASADAEGATRQLAAPGLQRQRRRAPTRRARWTTGIVRTLWLTPAELRGQPGAPPQPAGAGAACRITCAASALICRRWCWIPQPVAIG
jgi:hypothetical protein